MPTIGSRLIELASVGSTNNYAAKHLASGELAHGTVILAKEQTAGQGQRGRQWHSAPGLDLALSVVLQPQALPVMAQFTLSKAVALAVHDVVAEVLREAGKEAGEARVKWPNDVMVGRRKVAGILIANELRGARVASSIVGIGLNVNSTSLDEGLEATSLLLETGGHYDLHALVRTLCARMEHWWSMVGEGSEAIAAAYSGHLWAKGRFAEFTLDGAPLTARAIEVDQAGRLIVEDEQGHVAAYGLERLRFKR